MSEPQNVIFLYDGSLQGLLCCVFEAVSGRMLPLDIQPEQTASPTLFETCFIETDPAHAARVARSVSRKIGPRACQLVGHVFLSCAPKKELLILRFLLRGWEEGPRICNMLGHPDVAPLIDAEKHLLNEAHLLKGFLRFSDYGGILGAVIGPKNEVLPLLAGHFCQRLGNEEFMIWDKTHKVALYWHDKKAQYFGMEQFTPPPAGAAEQQYRRMWKRFYDTIAIPQRRNPSLRQNLCPKRYWAYMHEMEGES